MKNLKNARPCCGCSSAILRANDRRYLSGIRVCRRCSDLAELAETYRFELPTLCMKFGDAVARLRAVRAA